MDRAYILYQDDKEVCVLKAKQPPYYYPYNGRGNYSESRIEKIVERLERDTGSNYTYRLVKGTSKIKKAMRKINVREIPKELKKELSKEREKRKREDRREWKFFKYAGSHF